MLTGNLNTAKASIRRLLQKGEGTATMLLWLP
ncbi:hypothetical protein Goari_024609 [Gossypium aridum]|uniref:Uncharacterized protein n=1 Tax=Gossypium aridum TaxID=34290 RepID=A0A7J8X7M9_GOSAI|nr:hypothetical protein [Gossypium aridum]